MRTCRICKDNYEAKYSSLQPVCNNPACMGEHARNTRIKANKKEQLAKRKEDKAFKQKHLIEKLGYQHNLTKPVFNRMRVLEEKLWFVEKGLEPRCISCGKPNMDWCCGHFKSVGHQGGLRYDRRNTYLQCNRACNESLSGNIEGNKSSHGYKKGLILRFGQEEGQSIIDYCETSTAPVKWEWQELKELRKECNARIRQLTREMT